MSGAAAAAAGGPPADGSRPQTYTDADGTVMEWDPAKGAYFPKLDEAFLAAYTLSYGNNSSSGGEAAADAWEADRNEENRIFYRNTATGELTFKRPAEMGPPTEAELALSWVEQADPKTGKPLYYNTATGKTTTVRPAGMKKGGGKKGAAGAEGGKKRKAGDDVQVVDGKVLIPDDKNPNVYVTGLPEDITETEFAEFMGKAGIIARDFATEELKCKLYRNPDGTPKGDGRCRYLKVASVDLALQVLDEAYIRPGYPVKISRAVFQDRGREHGGQKNKKKRLTNEEKRLKAKEAKMKEKLLGWEDDTEYEKPGIRKRALGCVVIKNMFDPKDFEADPGEIVELKRDLQEECARWGAVKNVTVFDRNAEGIVMIKFESHDSVAPCVARMNGRWFSKRQLVATPWDGHTKYGTEETEAERAARLAAWDKHLEEGSSSSSDDEEDANKA